MGPATHRATRRRRRPARPPTNRTDPSPCFPGASAPLAPCPPPPPSRVQTAARRKRTSAVTGAAANTHGVTENGVEAVRQLGDAGSDLIEMHRLRAPIALDDVHGDSRGREIESARRAKSRPRRAVAKLGQNETISSFARREPREETRAGEWRAQRRASGRSNGRGGARARPARGRPRLARARSRSDRSRASTRDSSDTYGVWTAIAQRTRAGRLRFKTPPLR